jgi:hypothetical protein
MIVSRFAERGEQGGFQQQDANECWMELLKMLQQKTKVFRIFSVFIYEIYYLAVLWSRSREPRSKN